MADGMVGNRRQNLGLLFGKQVLPLRNLGPFNSFD